MGICGTASTYDLQGGKHRDTDWYLISPEALAAADADSNGAVQITAHVVAEFNAVTFFMDPGDPACASIADPTCGGGCWDAGSRTAADAVRAIVVADHPNGIAVFTAPGACSGAGIFDGYQCATGTNDYVLTITFSEPPTACGDPDIDPALLPCNTPNPGVPGCNDPACCTQVCTQFTPLCCAVGWAQQCADAAVDVNCAPLLGGPVCLALGTCDGAGLEGYLKVCADPLGAWADTTFGGMGDLYNPPGGATAEPATFSSAFFLYRAAAQQRELLSNNPQWKTNAGVDDESLSTQILCVNPSCAAERS